MIATAAPGMLFHNTDVVAIGAEHSTLDKPVREAAERIGYEVSPDPYPEETLLTRSDMYQFVKRGVPAVSIADGLTGAGSTGPDEPVRQWLTKVYHRPGDNGTELRLSRRRQRRAAEFLVGYLVASSASIPQWNPGDFLGTKFSRSVKR